MPKIPLRIHIPDCIRFLVDKGDTFAEIATLLDARDDDGEPMIGEQLEAWYEAHKHEDIYSS